LTCLCPPEKSFSTEVLCKVVVLDPSPSKFDFTCERGYSIAVLVVLFVHLPFFFLLGAGAGVDVREVERIGLGEVAQLEHDDDPLRDVLEGSGALHPGVALGVQDELWAVALGAWCCFSAWEPPPPPHPATKKSRKRHDA
jgi:hypothetical protein